MIAHLVKHLPAMQETTSLIPGSRRSAGEGIRSPLQYSLASLVAHLVKNPPAMQETWVPSVGCEDPLEKGTAYPLQYSGLENSTDCVVHGVAKSQTQLSDFHQWQWPPSFAELKWNEATCTRSPPETRNSLLHTAVSSNCGLLHLTEHPSLMLNFNLSFVISTHKSEACL